MATVFRKIPKMPSILTWILATLVRLVCKTCKVRYTGATYLINEIKSNPAVVTLWHNRILFFPECAPKESRKHLTITISRSRDGGYVSDFVKYFGLSIVRGSSKKGGATAFRELLAHLQKGNWAMLTVDGPRGPKYSIQPGAAALSIKTGFPIVPVCLNTKTRWEIKSWDRLQIPKPFSDIEVVLGEPYFLPEGVDPTSDEVKQLVYDKLMAVTDDSRK